MKTLILIRHAHRHKHLSGDQDNGISETGEKQAAHIKKYFRKNFPEAQPFLVSSPKLRCIETLLPLAGGDESRIEISANLDENGRLEHKADTFIKWWRKKPVALTAACSHGDLIPVIVHKLAGVSVNLKKGSLVEFYEDDKTGEIEKWRVKDF